MREEFAKAEGLRGTFTAKFSRFGTKKAFKGPPLTTVLLLDVKDASSKVTCDHIWFTAGKQFKNLMLKPGDEIQFDARITGLLEGLSRPRILRRRAAAKRLSAFIPDECPQGCSARNRGAATIRQCQAMMSASNPIYSHAPRDYQTIRCCGAIYRRWRFKGQKSFDHGKRFLHATHCKKCGCLLEWPAKFEPEKTAEIRKAEQQEAYLNRKVDWRLAGKNSLGKPWGRTPTYLTEHEKITAQRRRGAKAWSKRVENLKRLGLTTRGTKPKYKRGKTGLAKLYQELRASIHIPAAINFEMVKTGSLNR